MTLFDAVSQNEVQRIEKCEDLNIKGQKSVKWNLKGDNFFIVIA